MRASSIGQLLLLTLLLASGPCRALAEAGASQPLPSFSATYEVRRNGLKIGEVELNYRQPGDGSYSYQSETRPTGLAAVLFDEVVLESSSGIIDHGRLKPLRYEYRRPRSNKNRDISLVFDWANKRAAVTAKGERWNMDLPEGTLDKFAQQIVLMQELEDGVDKHFYQVADGGRLKTYGYTDGGEERIETPLGTFDTVRMLRSKQGGPPRLTLWCAPVLRHLPVRAGRDQEEGSFEMELTAVHGLSRGTAAQDLGSVTPR